MRACASCGEQNPDRAKFCLSCGEPLPESESGPRREVRKTVTVLFTDLAGSTALGERLDPESLRRVMDRYFERMSAVVESHGGVVEKFIGDAIMAVFGIPVLHEDDALRAVRSADGMRDALVGLNQELAADFDVAIEVRTGVNTGEVVTGQDAGQRLVTGDAVNVAARLEQAAASGEILVGEATYRLVRDAVLAEPVEPLTLKGKAETVPAYRITRVEAGAEGLSRRLDSPMVGRDHERSLLAQAFDRAVEDRTCHLFTVLGSAGVGKSRLVADFLAAVENRAQIIRGRCLPYGEGITFWPIREVVSKAAGIAEEDSPDVASARLRELLADEPESIASDVAALLGFTPGVVAPEEGARAVRRLFETLARRRPLVVLFDDIHWAEPGFLDLVEHIADLARDAPILLLCVARPELLEVRPGWGGGKLNATSILLQPLSPTECRTLMENLLGGAGLDAATAQRIVEAAEGNPLFVEQMIAALVDDGILERHEGRWAMREGVLSVPVPESIHALLAARLDRLGQDERSVIERASVVGRVFYRSAVTELAPDTIRASVESHLVTLVRKDLIRPQGAEFADEDTYRFLHMLIRDAAYESMPKEVRADLHERFAGWLESVAGSREREFEEIVAYHLEQACLYRREIGPSDETLEVLARGTAARLFGAAERAGERGDARAGVGLFGRAIALLPSGDDPRPRSLLTFSELLEAAGDPARAHDVRLQAADIAARSGDEPLATLARALAGVVSLSLDPTVRFAGVLDDLERAVEVLRPTGDMRLLTQALVFVGLLQFWLGRSAEALKTHTETMKLAEAAHDEVGAGRARRAVCTDLVFGALPAPLVIEEARRCLEATAGGPDEAQAQGALAIGLGMIGSIEEGRTRLARAREIFTEFGQSIWVAAGHVFAEFETIAGDHAAVIEQLEPGLRELESIGETGFATTTAAHLAYVYVEAGRLEDAEVAARKSAAWAAEDDVDAQCSWRVALARVMARRRDWEQAEGLIAEAVRVVEGMDYHNRRGWTFLAAAEVAELRGDRDEAAGWVRRAIEEYDLRENRVSSDAARAKLASLEGPA
jgi:class 3 adenylate cyclase/tetratricopeptide (TPR) repeat protein